MTHIIQQYHRSAKVPQRRFNSENVTISLTVTQNTAHLNISDIQTFTIWCEAFTVFFARLDLPTDVTIPTIVSNSMHYSYMYTDINTIHYICKYMEGLKYAMLNYVDMIS